MRLLTDHIVNGLNQSITIAVMDEPGQGGACHEYQLNLHPADGAPPTHLFTVKFQNGPVREAGFNGASQEALLAIVIDRLRSFQAGPYACRENQSALEHTETALSWLKTRTRNRAERGVEGTSEK